MLIRTIFTTLILAGVLVACTTELMTPKFSAAIRYTEHGIPHIKSNDFKGAGYGAGYAFAEGNLCLFADHVVTLNGERSKYFGAKKGYNAPFVLFNDSGIVNNFSSDAYFKYNYTNENIAFVKSGASQNVRDLITGFVAGYNRQLLEMRRDRKPVACINKPWVRNLTEGDIYRRALNVNILETGDLFRMAIPSAVLPQNMPITASTDSKTRIKEQSLQLAMDMKDLKVGGSNVMAFGKLATENGKGLVFSNPHFPWYSSERQYVMHLTVGDEYDAMGSTLLGLPIPLAGWNESMAWSITYSTDQRFSIYELNLDENDPGKYIVDGEVREMVAVPVVIDVLQSDGQLKKVTHTIYETDFGTLISAGPFTWTSKNAYALMDFSIGNNRMMDQYLSIGQAKNVRQVKAAQDKYLGLQFSNIGAADMAGETYYSNMSVSADYSDEKILRCFAGDKAKAFFTAFNSLLLKSTADCLPDNDSAAPQPNIIPANRRPFIFRDDYVINTNASHWIVNADPTSYLAGFNKTIGNENAARGERTRATIKMVEDRLGGLDGLPGNKMTTDHLLNLFYRGHNHTAELIVDDLVAGCFKKPIVVGGGVEVDLTEACNILDKWDRRNGIDSVGAIIFEVFSQVLPRKFAVDYLPLDQFWKTPYDPSQPLTTPRGFNVTDQVLQALARAVKMIEDNGIALNTPYGMVHGSKDKLGEFYALPGGRSLMHAISILHEPGKGFTGQVTSGNSYMHMVSLTDQGPKAKLVLAYSQATDSESDYFMDQFPLYATGNWIDMPFTEAQIKAADHRLVQIHE